MKFSLREYFDIYKNSYNSIEFTYLEYGLYGDYLKAIKGSSYSAELPLGNLKYEADVYLSTFMCDIGCNVSIDGIRITINFPSTNRYYLLLTAYDTQYLTSFVLDIYEPGLLSVNFNSKS